MAEFLNTTSMISNRTALYAMAEMLMRATPLLVFEKFGQVYPIPANSTKTAKFRRFEALNATPTALVEGVTPQGKQLIPFDVSCTLEQYGDLIVVTDVIHDTNEDPILRQAVEVLGEQAALMLENMRYNILKAGTNVLYDTTAHTSRDTVDSKFTLGLHRRAIRKLKQFLARPITSVVRSTPSYATQNILPSYVAICHPDLEADLRGLGSSFVDVKDYGQYSPMEGEIGAVEGVRFIASTVIAPFTGSNGGANIGSTGMLSTDGVKVDVYPILYFGKDAYGIVPLKGKSSVTPTVLNPGVASKSDPLGQRGYVGWKAMQTCVRLNETWMLRAEVGATANPS